MEEYKEDMRGNKRYIIHETYSKHLPKILIDGLSRMDKNHVHLCKQIGGSWIRKKKRANIAIYIDVQEARRNGIIFFSAPNDVIMCSGDEKDSIPIKYFKEIRNIQTGEQIEIKLNTIADKTRLDKCLNPLVQNYVPNRPTAVTSLTTNNFQEPLTSATSNRHHTVTSSQTTPKYTYKPKKCTKMILDPTNAAKHINMKYCGEHYDEVHAWKNILAEQKEYIELLTLEKDKEYNKDVTQTQPNKPTNSTNLKDNVLQHQAYYPTPQKATDTERHTKPAQTTHQPPQTHESTINGIPETNLNTQTNSETNLEPLTTSDKHVTELKIITATHQPRDTEKRLCIKMLMKNNSSSSGQTSLL